MNEEVDMRFVILLCFVIALAGCTRNEQSVSSKRDRAVAEFWKEYLPRSIPTESEKVALAQVYKRIATAYLNGRTCVLRDCISLLSNRVEKIDYHIYPSIAQPAKDLLYQKFLLGRELKSLTDFASAEDFAAYLAVNMEMVRLIGCSEARRTEPHNAVDWMEGMTLRRIAEYRQKCLDSGKDDYATVAERTLMDWTSCIESDNGLTRMKMRHLLPILRERAKVVGKSERDVIKDVRSYALCLINCGYTPKWLDEEFPAESASQH